MGEVPKPVPPGEGEGHYSGVPRDRDAVAKAIGAKEVGVFSKEDAKKLAALKSTVSATNRAEALLANGQSVPVMEKGADGEVTRSPLSEQHVSKMKQAAFALYEEHLFPDARLRTAANDIIAGEKKLAEKRKAKKDAEVKELQTIWDRSSDADPDNEERIPR